MGMWPNAVTLCHFKMAVSGWTLDTKKSNLYELTPYVHEVNVTCEFLYTKEKDGYILRYLAIGVDKMYRLHNADIPILVKNLCTGAPIYEGLRLLNPSAPPLKSSAPPQKPKIGFLKKWFS